MSNLYNEAKGGGAAARSSLAVRGSGKGTQTEPIELEKIVVRKGTKVYRAWGDDAGPYGRSWTTTDPNSVPNFRSEAGLPPQNTGRFVSEGTVIDPSGIKVKPADSIYGNPGGLEEVVIPDPQSQVQLDSVSGVNPEY
ncbi:MAG: hypothetical protein ABIA66_02540, partial [Candidatus Omnitrophota bacterium]